MRDSREVVTRLLKRDNPTRMGLYELFWPETLKAWVNDGYPVDDKGEPQPPDDVFECDMVWTGGWFDVLPLKGVEQIVEETDDWVLKRNGAGASLKWWKNKCGCPEHVDFRMTTREIWEKEYRSHLLQVDPERVKLEDTRQNQEKRLQQGIWRYYGNLFIWENMRQSMGDLCLYESMVLDPGWIHDYNRVYTDFFKAHYKLVFDEVGLPDGIWVYEDLGYKNGTFCSPKSLEELIFPYYAELVEFFHSYDLPVLLHSCGNVTEVVPQIIDAGFVSINPMEVKAGCDVLQWAKDYGDKLTFVGGLDTRVLEEGDQDAIRKEIVRITDTMKALSVPYLFASDHSISSNVSYDAYRFALDVYRKNMYY